MTSPHRVARASGHLLARSSVSKPYDADPLDASPVDVHEIEMRDRSVQRISGPSRAAAIVSRSVCNASCFGRQPSSRRALLRHEHGSRKAAIHCACAGRKPSLAIMSATASTASSGTGIEYQPSSSASWAMVSPPDARGCMRRHPRPSTAARIAWRRRRGARAGTARLGPAARA